MATHHIEKRLIPGLPRIGLYGKNFIVAHEAGNPNNTGANSLDNEIKYMTNNWRNAFVSHFVGGGGKIVQLAPAGLMQYGAGSPANRYAYAQVELARTNSAATFKKDYAAYVWLLRYLATQAGIPIKVDTGSGTGSRGIKSHDWIRRNLGGTTHTDPYAYFRQFGITPAQFKKDVESGKVGGKIAKPSSTSATKTNKKPTNSGWTKVTGKWTGQTLKRGQYGNPVKQMQTKLSNNNPPFYPNKGDKNHGVDSYYGSDTENAVRRFQSYYGLAVDGMAGKEVYKKLTGKKSTTSKKKTGSSFKIPSRTLSQGSRGQDVRNLQQALASIHFYPNKNAKNNGVDGIYGKDTANAVRRFQSVYIPDQVDGIAGKNTYKKLKSLVK